MKNSGGRFQNLDLLQRQSSKLSFRDDGTASWKTFLSSEVDDSKIKSPYSPAVVAPGYAAFQLVCFSLTFFYQRESFEPGEDIISRHRCLMAL